MSKELEALKEIYDGRTMTQKEYIFFEQLVRFNEPMKVKRKTYLTDINCDGPIGLCPNCNRFVKDIYRRCPDCGQRLDWSDK